MSNSNRNITIDLKKPIKLITGESMKDGDNIATIGSSVANALVNNPQVDEPLRAYRIAKEWYSGGKQYSVTEDDLDYILNQWKKLPFTALLKGQVQQYLEDAKAKFVNKRE